MPPYEIVVDDANRTLRATLHGFWEMDAARAYLAALAVAAERVARGGAPSWWLIDLSDCTLQSRDVTTLMSEKLAGLIPPHTALAVVAPGALHAMQAKRVAADDTHRYFASVAAADAWLTSQGQPA